jgi:hypothetical protein
MTTPFAAVVARAGLAVDELRAALAVCCAHERAHPFFELECMRMSEAQFLASLEQALRAGARPGDLVRGLSPRRRGRGWRRTTG